MAGTLEGTGKPHVRLSPRASAPGLKVPSCSTAPNAFHPEINALDQRLEAMAVQQEAVFGEFARKASQKEGWPAARPRRPSVGSPENQDFLLGPSGPCLDWPPSDRNVSILREYFESGPRRPIPVAYIAQLLIMTRQLLMQTGTCAKVQLKEGPYSRMIIVGDIHGQLNDLLWVLHVQGPPSPNGTQYLFNGDFVDRGEFGIEVLTLVCTMKCAWPGAVFLNRGNHENLSANVTYGFARECHAKYDPGIFHLCQEVFEALPLVHVINDRIFVVHGGLPRHDGVTLEDIRRLPRCSQIVGYPTCREDCILFDLLWADPIPMEGRRSGGRGAETWQFGKDVTNAFLDAHGFTHIVRSHQVPSSGQGFEVLHDGALVTVFSASNYCGITGNLGAVLVVTPDLTLEAVEYYSPPLAELRDAVAAGLTTTIQTQRSAAPDPDHVLQASLNFIRQFIIEKKKELEERFLAVTGGQRPFVTVVEWIQTMAFVLGLDLDWAPLQPHLAEAQPPDGHIDYQQFLDRYQIHVAPLLQDWARAVRDSLRSTVLRGDLGLQELVDMFDHDHNGFVEEHELRAVLARLDFRPTPEQLRELTQGLVRNESGAVHVTAFIDSLQQRPTPAELGLNERGATILEDLRRVVRRQGVQLVKLFTTIDTSGNGKVEYPEFLAAMRAMAADWPTHGIPEDDLLQVVAALDRTKTGALCYLEFVDAFATPFDLGQKLVNHVLQALLKYRISFERAFFMLDTDGDGLLTPEKFKEGLVALNDLMEGCFQLSPQDIETLVAHLDTNEDGRVDYNEFCTAFAIVDTHALLKGPASPS